MLVLSFIFGMSVMYLLRYLPRLNVVSRKYSYDESLKVLYAHIGEDKEIEEMVRKLYAVKNGDKSVKIDNKKLKEMVKRFS